MQLVRIALVGACSLLVSGCGSGGSDQGGDREQIKQVIAKGQRALAANRPAAVCRLMTARARRRSLGFGSEYTGTGRRARSEAPRTCRQAIGDQIYFARRSPSPNVPDDLKSLEDDPDIEIVEISGAAAHVRLPRFDVDLYMSKSGSRWRADRTDDFPFDGSTGE
ncbi:MAG: hypothetical protein ACR2J6_04780 [Thermoleophilaceae bacterium]